MLVKFLKGEKMNNKFHWIETTKTGRRKVNPQLLGDEILKRERWVYTSKRGEKLKRLYRYNPKSGAWYEVSASNVATVVFRYLKKANMLRDARPNDTALYIKLSIPVMKWADCFGRENLAFNFKSGVWDWSTMKMREHRPDDYFLSCADYDPDPDGGTTETDNFFKGLFGENVRPVMEYLGYSFYPSYEPIKAVMFIQSAEHLERYRIEFLDYLYSVLTNYNCLSTTCLAKGWNLYGLQERHINAFNDYTKPTVYRTDFLKPLTGAVSINAKTKNNKKFEYTNYAKLWFGTENIHQFLDASSEWSERLFALTIDYKISFKKFDAAKIKQERGAFIYKCLQLAKDAIDRGKLTETEDILYTRKAWQEENRRACAEKLHP